RKEQCCDEVALLPSAQLCDLRVLARSFFTAVPAPVVVGSVAILLSVRLVMFRVVADQVLERKSVMRGHEIYAGIRSAPASRIQVARSRNSIREFPDNSPIPFPVGAQRIAILVIPLGPTHGKFSDLIAAFAQIPRLSNQFDLGQNRVLMNDV